jgi:hypothetical protein
VVEAEARRPLPNLAASVAQLAAASHTEDMALWETARAAGSTLLHCRPSIVAAGVGGSWDGVAAHKLRREVYPGAHRRVLLRQG